VETVSESIWEADANGVITFVSPRIYNILGYKPEEVLGKRPFEFMSPEESKRTSAIFKKLVAEKKPIRSLEGTYIHKNGHTVLQEANGFPYFDKEGALLGYRGSDRDITEQKQILTELQQNKRDLENKSKTLEELNIALKVLLQQKTKDEEELEERFTSNASQLILPYIEKMKKSRLDERQQSYVTIMEANLNEIMSPFLHRVQQLNLAPREIQVANLIKNGKSTKEIAEIIGIAPASVNFYRKNIRDKLNLTNQKVNLQSYLQTFK
jgi:PAS domain S-box-containing protein